MDKEEICGMLHSFFLSNFKSKTLQTGPSGKLFFFYSAFCCPYMQTQLISDVGLLSLTHRTCGNKQRKGVCLICHQMLPMSQKIIGLSSSNWWVTMGELFWPLTIGLDDNGLMLLRCCHLCACDVHVVDIFFLPVFCISNTLACQTGQLAQWLKTWIGSSRAVMPS